MATLNLKGRIINEMVKGLAEHKRYIVNKGGEGIVVAGEEAKVEPFAEFGPRFGFKLGLCVGGDHTTGIGECAESPESKLSDGCGLGDTVAGGDGFLNGGVYVDKAIADTVHKVAGPLLGA